jgi:hypothetical protein
LLLKWNADDADQYDKKRIKIYSNSVLNSLAEKQIKIFLNHNNQRHQRSITFLNKINKLNGLKFTFVFMEKDEGFDKLRELLNEDNNWPRVYMFKFIIPADNHKIALVESKFSDEAIITHKASSSGKYFSITVKEAMLNADSIIEKYKEMKGIEGLMAL